MDGKVAFEVVSADEGFFASGALVRFLRDVDLPVGGEVERSREGLVADFTDVGAMVGVDKRVLIKNVLSREGLLTDLAFKWLQVRMGVFVGSQVARLGKRLVTYFALVRPLSCMGVHVHT